MGRITDACVGCGRRGLQLNEAGQCLMCKPAPTPALIKKPDPVNSPPHYGEGAHEAINCIEAHGLGFCLGNAVKYIFRAGKKTRDCREDLMKARWYINRALLREGVTE